jgi:hypothetical protein
MYIEFDILNVMDNLDSLEDAVTAWAKTHDVPYTTKVAKGFKYRLGLNHPEHFTLFFITWSACEYQVKNAKQH